MGVYASSVINLSIPAANVPALAQALRDWITADNYRKSGYPLPESDQELVGTLLVESEGCEEAPEYEVAPDWLHIVGSYYGKISYDAEVVESIYGRHGAVGYIDVEAEGERWRVRFTKDGRILRIAAQVSYPGDVE